jgi:multiple sugar transport system ATP-binding protein
MVYVTHDQTEAMTMGDRIVVMKDGIIHQSADPLTLYDKPADKFVAGFIGMPPMNFFEGVIETRGSSLAFTCDGGAIVIAIPARMTGGLAQYAGKPITLGIRPEDIGSNSAVQTEGAPSLRATVEVLEPMGAETFVYFKTGTHSFVSRVEPHIGWRVGETVNVPLYVPRLHFFDGVTEKAIAP